MATILDATNMTPCQIIQGTIGEAFLRHPGAQPTPAGAYDALVSPINRTGFIQTANSFAGGKPTASSNRKVQVRYVAASCDEEQEDLEKCEFPSNEPAFSTADLTADLTYTWGFTLDEDEYRDLCDGDINNVYSQMLLAKYQRAKKEFNAKIVTAIAALPGNYPTTGADSLTSPISLPIVTSAGTYLPTGFGILKTIFNAADISDDPVIIAGRGIPELAVNSLRYSALNTVPGYQVAGGIPNLFIDGNLNSTFNDGSDHMIAFAPGAIQLVEWYQNVGSYGWVKTMTKNGVVVPEEQYTTIVTPDGITWDFAYKFDCGKHQYKFSKAYGVAPIPSDAFGECRDYNYILNFLAVCGDLECSDISAALTPAALS